MFQVCWPSTQNSGDCILRWWRRFPRAGHQSAEGHASRPEGQDTSRGAFRKDPTGARSHCSREGSAGVRREPLRNLSVGWRPSLRLHRCIIDGKVNKKVRFLDLVKIKKVMGNREQKHEKCVTSRWSSVITWLLTKDCVESFTGFSWCHKNY